VKQGKLKSGSISQIEFFGKLFHMKGTLNSNFGKWSVAFGTVLVNSTNIANAITSGMQQILNLTWISSQWRRQQQQQQHRALTELLKITKNIEGIKNIKNN
jgi:hypothetical protein